MQKLVRRAATADRQAAKRLQKKKTVQFRLDLMKERYQRDLATTEIRQNVKDARAARKEAWELGPIAPRRDLGAYNHHGAVKEGWRVTWHTKMEDTRANSAPAKRCEWAGGINQLCLVEGDRVAIVDGPGKGKIDKIKSVHAKAGAVLLENHGTLNTNPIAPEEVFLSPVPVPINAIRLVYPLTNPETGVTKDTLIHQLKRIPADMSSENMTFERWEYGQKFDRIVPGLNTVIPWPEVEAPTLETHPSDTIRSDVEERTFYYNLLSPPVPEGVLDELRNKYSRFRTRHDPWYIMKKEAEENKTKRRHAMLMDMQTPRDELRQKRKDEKAALGEPELSGDMLEKLGEIIAKTKAASLEDAGVSEVPKSQ